MHISVVGLGLIGGSMALDLKASSFATEIIGVDNNEEHCQSALDLQLVDRIAALDTALEVCDLMILAVPVHHILETLPEILEKVTSQVIIDVGSTKRLIAERVKKHRARGRYVATHPMAGTEFSGPKAATKDLFRNKAAIFCDEQLSDPEAVQIATRLYQSLGMPIIKMKASEHDLHAAFVSHISHISSFALALTVLEKEKDERNILNLASGGFDSTVRLAKSSAEMWAPIFAQNSLNVIKVLDTYMEELERFKQAIQNQDTEALSELILEANKIRKIL